MKPPARAAAYACIYHGLTALAQKHGYNLCIHGSMHRDLDLVAIPWTDEAVDAETLVAALMDHLGACLFPDLLRRQGLNEQQVANTCERMNHQAPSIKPHGRRAWSLHMEFGAYIDLSVMPRSAVKFDQ